MDKWYLSMSTEKSLKAFKQEQWLKLTLRPFILAALCRIDNRARKWKAGEQLDAITIGRVSGDGTWTVKTKEVGLNLRYILKVEPIGLADRLTMGQEEKEEAKTTTRYFGWAARWWCIIYSNEDWGDGEGKIWGWGQVIKNQAFWTL